MAAPRKPKVEETTLNAKAEEKVTTPAETKAEVKKETETKTTAAKKTAEKKTTATKKTPGRKPGRKPAAKTDVIVEFGGSQFSEKDIKEKVVAAWEAEGKKASAIKKAKLYIKPEDRKAYYVINEGLKDGSTGDVDL